MEKSYELHAAQACSFLRTYHEEPFVRHEWEELLGKLSDSEDPVLHGIGIRERNAFEAGAMAAAHDIIRKGR